MSHRNVRFVILICFVLLASTPALSAVLHVANNGDDDPACGGQSDPCRSINQAIDNATPGSKIIVRPGRYSPATEGTRCGGDCMVLVDKRLTLVSTRGPAVTVLDAAGDRIEVVRIEANDVVFGLVGKGFTLTGADGNNAGVLASGVADLKIAGNRSIANGGDGIAVQDGRDRIVDGNLAYCNDGSGFDVDGGGTEVLRNLAVRNRSEGFRFTAVTGSGVSDIEAWRNAALFTTDGGDGFFLSQATPISLNDNLSTASTGLGFYQCSENVTQVRSVAIAGDDEGFYFCGEENDVLQLSAAVGNRGAGIRTAGNDLEVSQTNLFGNDDPANCGLENVSGLAFVAPMIYWGDPGGPGPDPGDETCETNGAIDASAFSTSEFNQPFSWLPL